MVEAWRPGSPLPFLEREPQLAALQEAMAGAVGGRGGLVFVTGEAGVGKTALVRRFAASCPEMILGTCDPLETPRPLGPLFDMAPHLGAGVQALMAASPSRFEIFTALAERLASAAAPPLLVFEDVHWGDQATLDLLRFLGRRLDRLPALVVATVREEELGPGSAAAVLLGDLATAPGVSRLSLPPLSREATGALAAGAGVDPDDLHRRTGGNPFFILAVLTAGGEELPTTARDAVLARVTRLSPAAREALEAAAAIGPRVDPDLLGAVLEATATPRWATREAVLAGLLLWRGPGLVFRHELAQAAIAGATPPERRQRLHAAVLELLRRDPGGAGDPVALVRHAEAAGDDRAVVELAPAAAARAARLNAHREAAALYARALAHGRDQPDARRAELTERRAEQCYLAGQLDEAMTAQRAAADLCLQAGDRLGQGRNLSRVSYLGFLAGRYDEVEPAGDAAIACLEALGPSRELALAYDSRARLRFMAQDAPAAAAWGERAVAVAESLGEAEVALEARVTAAAARLQDGDERALDTLRAALAAARARGLEDLAARATLYLGWLPLLQHRYDGVDRHLAEGLAYAEECELGYWRSLLAGARVRWCLDTGRWQEVEARARDVLERPDANILSTLQALVALGRLRARRGDAAASDCLDRAAELARRHPEAEAVALVWPARAEAAWLGGDLAGVLRQAESALEQAAGVRSPWWAGELAYWVHRAGGSPDPAHPVAEPYRRAISGDWAGAAGWWESRGCPYEAALALASADEPDAVARAIASFDRLGAQPAAAHARQRLRQLGVATVPRGPRPSTRASPAGLTRREREVLGLVAGGLTNAGIASRLFLSQKTVERHLSSILGKLDVTSRSEAVTAARRLGALPD